MKPEKARNLIDMPEFKELLEEVDDWIFQDWRRAETPKDREKLYAAREGVFYMKRILQSTIAMDEGPGLDLGGSDGTERASH